MGPARKGPVRLLCRDLHTAECYDLVRMYPSDNRPKFNVALGIEAQRFCVLESPR
jgi:hypothetical protein